MSLILSIYLTLSALFANETCSGLFDNSPKYTQEYQAIRRSIIYDLNPHIAVIASNRAKLKENRKIDETYPADSTWMDIHEKLLFMKSLVRYESKDSYDLVNELALVLTEREFQNISTLDLILDVVVEYQIKKAQQELDKSKKTYKVFEKNRIYLMNLDMIYDRINYYRTNEAKNKYSVEDISNRVSYFMELNPNVKKLSTNQRVDLLSELLFYEFYETLPAPPDAKKVIEDFIMKQKKNPKNAE